MRAERQELGLSKKGRLAELLGEALPGEPPAALERLASEAGDRHKRGWSR